MTAGGPVPDFDAVILAGGLAARMRGADKPALAVGGTAMVVLVARAAAAGGARRLVVVGPMRPGPVQAGLAAAGSGLPGGLVRVREEPAGGGPVPALRRGLAEVSSPWVAVLAADLPFLAGADLALLLRAALAVGDAGRARAIGTGHGGGAAGAVLTDQDGREQWLAGLWQTQVLRQGLAGYQGSSLGGLLAPLGPVLLGPAAVAAAARETLHPGEMQSLPDLGGDGAAWLDCDTPADLAAARTRAGDS